MALHTRVQFAKLIGKERNWVSQYIKRGKIIMSGDYIDDQQEINAALIEYWQAMAARSTDEREHLVNSEEENRNAPDPVYKADVKPMVQPGKAPKVAGDNDASYSELEKRKLLLETQQREQDVRIRTIKADKAEGLIIPTDLVKPLFLQYGRFITNSFRDVAEDLLTNFKTKYHVSDEDIAAWRKSTVDAINTKVEQAINDSDAHIQHIVDEYSEVRGKGERK